jgi:hypothetical protein
MSAPQPFLPREQEQALHAQLCAEDAVAAKLLFRTYYLPLVGWLRGRHRKLDDALIEEAAERSLAGLIEKPWTYDSERLDLFGYLRMSAAGDLKNLAARERRHQEHREPWFVVENAAADGNSSGEVEEPSALLQQVEEVLAADEFFHTCSDGWTALEKQVLELMRRGTAGTEAIARVLGLENLPFAEQQEKANRMKDRLMKRLQREGQRRA